MADAKEPEFSIRQIEEAIDAWIATGTGKELTAAQLIRQLGGKKLRALVDRIDRTLSGDDRFFDDMSFSSRRTPGRSNRGFSFRDIGFPLS